MVQRLIKRIPQLLVLAGLLALVGGAVLRAADDKGKKGGGDNRYDAETLKKYDKNANGRLDPDEEAALKADQAKSEKKKKG